MCGRIPSNCNSILFNVSSPELIKRTYYFNRVLYCAIAFRFIVDELWSICNSHEHWINNVNFTENTQRKRNVILYILILYIVNWVNNTRVFLICFASLLICTSELVIYLVVM